MIISECQGSELTCPTLFNYYPDQYDCTKFYRCVWGKATLFNCPAGTRWSQDILTCDHAANVPCNKGAATKIVYDDYSGNYQKSYDPERKAPDFSVDHYKGGLTTAHPILEDKKDPEPEPYFPDYKTYPKEKGPDYEPQPNQRIDYVGEYDRNYGPRKHYGNVDYRRFYPNLGYYYTTFNPHTSHPYDYQTTTEFYKGYPDLRYNPYYKDNFDGPYTSPGYPKNPYYEQQYRSTPSG